MTDVEHRLRADAARTDDFAPPSLDAALDTAVGTALGRRAPAVGWLAAAAVVIVLAGVTVVVALQARGPNRPAPASVPSLSDAPLHRDGRTLREEPDFRLLTTVFRVPADPRALDVLVPYGRAPGDCSVFGARVTVTGQSASDIRLRASGYVYVLDAELHKKDFSYSCSGGGTRVVRVRLDEPVGDRTVYGDSDAGRTVQIVDPSDAPAPTYLPRGYRSFKQTLPDARTGRTSALRVYRRGDSDLTVETGEQSDVSRPEGPVAGYADVHGARANVIDDPDNRCVVWHASSGQTREVCSAGPVLVSITEVLRVARSLD